MLHSGAYWLNLFLNFCEEGEHMSFVPPSASPREVLEQAIRDCNQSYIDTQTLQGGGTSESSSGAVTRRFLESEEFLSLPSSQNRAAYAFPIIGQLVRDRDTSYMLEICLTPEGSNDFEMRYPREMLIRAIGLAKAADAVRYRENVLILLDAPNSIRKCILSPDLSVLRTELAASQQRLFDVLRHRGSTSDTLMHRR